MTDPREPKKKKRKSRKKAAEATAQTLAPATASMGMIDVDWPERLSSGAPKKGSMMNVRAAIAKLNLTCSYDTFLDRYTINGHGLTQFVGLVNDKVARAFREYCYMRTAYEPGAEAAREGIMRACEGHMFNSLGDYLDGLRWDKKPRLDTWLTTYMGVEDSELHQAWGSIFLMAAVRRVFDPGCKFDYVLVFESPEGDGKSTAIKILACGKGAEERPEYFSDSTLLDKDERAQMELTKGVWFYELSEMSGMNRTDQKKLKAFITRQEERARPAYGYFKENQARIPVFIGTINPDANTNETIEYLNTGDRRRWWPVIAAAVHPIDLEGLQRDRDQLFAEALARVRTVTYDEIGLPEENPQWASLALDPSLYAAAAEEQKKREIEDSFEPILASLYADTRKRWHGEPVHSDGYSVNDLEVMVSAKHVLATLTTLTSTAGTVDGGRRIPRVMAKLGWRRVHTRTGNWYARPNIGEADDSYL